MTECLHRLYSEWTTELATKFKYRFLFMVMVQITLYGKALVLYSKSELGF